MSDEVPYKNRALDSLRKYVGKQLVSLVRQADFAHAGEEEAIDLVMQTFGDPDNRKICDVGCGLGGTAAYLQSLGWQNITGFDVDEEAIFYAARHYPDLHFYTANVTNAAANFSERFDLFLLFNTFYAFADQYSALSNLHTLANDSAKIAIFDYADCVQPPERNPLIRTGEDGATPFLPISIETLAKDMDDTGWKITDVVDISEQYLNWYNQLITSLTNQRAIILEKFNEAALQKALSTYEKLHDAIQQHILGGVIVYGEKHRK